MSLKTPHCPFVRVFKPKTQDPEIQKSFVLIYFFYFLLNKNGKKAKVAGPQSTPFHFQGRVIKTLRTLSIPQK